MKRVIQKDLLKWKDSTTRKPLLIYGARQVGKTWIMKHFGEAHFENYVYINFEKEKQLRTIFEQDYNPKRIIKLIEIHSKEKIIIGETLVIFDEIQEAIGGLTALKYFNEELNELHLIGAGSLLGISLKQSTSFPVGQVQFIHLYPMNFMEFIEAKGETGLLELLNEKDWEFVKTFRERYQQLLKEYFFVGGMPEVVKHHIQNDNYQTIRGIQLNIIKAYEQDFSKHAPNEIIPRIKMIWNSVVSQLAKENKKFIYGQIKEGARAKDFELALSWLEDYGLIYKVHRTKKANLPLKVYHDLSAFKLYIIDIGLLGALGNLDSSILLNGDQLFNEFKGSMTEQFVLQSLIQQVGLNYWSNDTGSAEVDFIFEKNNQIIPLEVKSAENLRSKSLKTFHEKNKGIHCYRTSLADYREEEWLTNIPLYGIGEGFKYF
jgi:predicted AAA+ superfamily ATPase